MRRRRFPVTTLIVILLVLVLFVSCTETPESSSVPPPSANESAGLNIADAVPGVEVQPSLIPDVTPEPATPIKPSIPPSKAVTPEIIKLSYDIMELSPKYRELEINCVDGDMLYASIIDMRANGDLLETEGFVAYNISSEETQIYPYTEGDRVLSFAVQGETVYYVSLGYGDGNYNWSLIKSDFTFTDKTELASGDMLSPYMSPVIVKEADKIYLISLDENNERGTFAISVVTDDTLRQILSVDTSDEYPINLTKVRVSDGYAYYMSSDETEQYVKKVDLATSDTETLYTLSNSKGMLHGFMQTEKMLFVSSLNEVGGMIITIKSEDDEVSYEFESILGHENIVQDGKVIVNDYGVLSTFDEAGKLDGQFEISDLEIFPYFIVYDEDTLIVQDVGSSEFYFCDIA